MASTKELFKKGIGYVKYDLMKALQEGNRELIRKYERELKHWQNYFSYTIEEIQNIPIPTDEELKRDLERDERETQETVNYCFEDILKKAHELDRQREQEQRKAL